MYSVHFIYYAGHECDTYLMVHVKLEVKQHKMEKVDVLILGGGIAGLAALKSLREQGTENYIILEGGDRLGGRIHSVRTEDGLVLEFGAGWIHRMDAFPIYDLAIEHKVKLHQTRLDAASARDDKGNNVTSAFHSAYAKLTNVCEATCELAKQKRICPEEPDISHQKALDLCGWRAKTVEDKCAEYLVYDFYYGMDNEKISTRFSFEYDPTDPVCADFRVIDESGFQGFVQKICGIDNLTNPGDPRVVLNTIVTEIVYTNEGVTVKTRNGTTYSARYAIMTFSLGVLKNKAVAFTPPLPEAKLRCIRELAMLNYMKVFVAFNEDVRPFWDSTEMIVYGCERKHHFTVWENLKICGNNILVGTLMDNEADAAIYWSEQELKRNVMEVLQNMFGVHIPEPKWIKTTSWATNPLFYGSFSGRPVGIAEDDIEKFKAPVGRLHFAGEAYSLYNYGDVNGAYRSGLEEGTTVASLLQEI